MGHTPFPAFADSAPVTMRTLPATSLRVGQWALLGLTAHRITNMRLMPGGDRLIEFEDRRPVRLHPDGGLRIYMTDAELDT
jgi:hypothetical protein